MNRIAKRFLVLSAVALMGSSAVLAQGMGGGDCHHPGFSPEQGQKFQQRMVQRHEQHQKELKAALKLTPEQEGAWKQFTDATQPDPKAWPRFDRNEWDKLATPQRLDKFQALRKERDERMNKHVEAIKQFYAVLSPEQQKVFDAQQLRMAFGGHGGERRMRHRPE